MTAADPLARVAALLRARQVSCRGGLDELAAAVLEAARPERPLPPATLADSELAWRRERITVLTDRDVLVCALQDLLDALARHTATRTRLTAAALSVAVADAGDALVPLALRDLDAAA